MLQNLKKQLQKFKGVRFFEWSCRVSANGLQLKEVAALEH